MIIGKPADVGQAPATQRVGSPAGGRLAGNAPVASGEDKVDSGSGATSVTLSDASRAMIAQTASTEIRESRVAELKLAIDEGRYKPDAGKIADRLLQDDLDLLGPVAPKR